MAHSEAGCVRPARGSALSPRVANVSASEDVRRPSTGLLRAIRSGPGSQLTTGPARRCAAHPNLTLAAKADTGRSTS